MLDPTANRHLRGPSYHRQPQHGPTLGDRPDSSDSEDPDQARYRNDRQDTHLEANQSDERGGKCGAAMPAYDSIRRKRFDPERCSPTMKMGCMALS